MFECFRACAGDRPAPPAPALYLARREFQIEGRWEAVTGIYAAWHRPGVAVWPAALAPEDLAQRMAPHLRRPPDLRRQAQGIDHWLWRVDEPSACTALLQGLSGHSSGPPRDPGSQGLAFIVSRQELRLAFQPDSCLGAGRPPRPAELEIIARHQALSDEAGQRQLVELEEDLRFEGLAEPVCARLDGQAFEICRLPAGTDRPPWEALDPWRAAGGRPLAGGLRAAADALRTGPARWALCLPPLAASRMFMLLGPDGPWEALPGTWHPGAPPDLIAIGRDGDDA